MLMMHCMMMMMSLLLSVMLSMMLAAPVRRVSVIKDKVVARLASPDLRHLALGHFYLPVVGVVRHGHLGRAVVVQLPGGGVARLLPLVVLRGVLQRQVVLVEVDGERDTMMMWRRQHFHVGADRRDRGGRVQLDQGCLQFQGVHV